MAQFRSTKDIADEVLQKSGEPTNGNSPYEALVMTYLNKVQQVIVGGGSLFSLDVDEPWTWARSKHPMVIELEPAYTFGTIALATDDVNFTLSVAPATSLEGWYIQVKDHRTPYRITSHIAGGTQGTIDSNYIGGVSGSFAFRAYKLDYDLVPKYYYINATNDRLDFIESGTTQLSVSLAHGSYTGSTLAQYLATRLNAVGTLGTYTANFDPVSRYFTLTSTLSGGKIFTLLGATGLNRTRSIMPTIGMQRLDATGSGSYVSSFAANGISRLIEPFNIYTHNILRPTIVATEPENLNVQFPTDVAHNGMPKMFAKVNETNDGVVTVRFNSYPRERVKVSIDWIPIPVDLQDNDANSPVIPRKDIDVLIHGAAMFILFDKEDAKWESMLKLTQAGLEAMKKKERSERFRAGEDFGQILPRPDLYLEPRKLRYGYTVNPEVSSTAPATVQTMIPIRLDYRSFQAPSTIHTVVARTLPANRTLVTLIIKHSKVFLGGSISQVYLSVGIPGDLTKFITAFDVTQAVANNATDSVITAYFPAQATDIVVTATATGANLSALTQGEVDIYFQEQVVQS